MMEMPGMKEAQQIDGWMSLEELTFLGENAARSTAVLQIGCYKGRSSFVIGKNIKGQLLDIDSFVGDHGNTLSTAELTEVYRNNVRELLGTKIQLMVGNSHEILPTLNRTFDMIFIDGSHSYEDVKRDIALCIPLLKPGGLLCGHDYSHSPDVKRAVDESLHGKAQAHLNTSIWFLRDDGSLIGGSAKKSTSLEQTLARFTAKKLHLGCGRKILPGYINIDLYRPEADLQLDIIDLSPIPSDSIDEIYLNAVFEHIYPFDQHKALTEWRRVLKPNGVLRMESTPDFDEVIKAYSRKAKGNTRGIFDLEEVIRYTHGEYGEEDKVGGIHKDIFTKGKMKRLLEAAGFSVDRIESVRWGSETHPVNIDLVAHKEAVPRSTTQERELSFGAAYCVYDDDAWLPESFASVYDPCDVIYFLVSDRPWQGSATSNQRTLDCIQRLPDPKAKVRLIKGSWSNETDQRNAGLALFKAAGIDYYFVVDADEIYDPVQLRQMQRYAAQQPGIACWHMTWDTYWKSPDYVIEPREPFKPVVFVKVGAAKFAQYRAVGGENHGLIPPEIGFCHHMSYARSDEQIFKKITTFSHAHEIQQGWFENIWMKWDRDQSLTNLHPTHPPAYQRAVRRSVETLPPVLRKRMPGPVIHAQAVKPGVVSIVILTFNQLNYTKECVESIRKHTPEAHELIFVDNGSTDGTVTWLKTLVKEHNEYRLIENGRNLGFSKGCNQGIEASRGEYVLLLNNDVVVTEHWLSDMLACLNSAPDSGIIGPLTNNISGLQKVEHVGYSSLDQLDAYAQQFREKNRYRRIPLRRIVGFCMLFRRALAEQIGFLDESFGSGNFEDDDYCLRAALLGHQNLIAGDVFIHHYGSRSFIGNNVDYGSSLSGNRKIFTDKWNGIDITSPLGKRLLVITALEQAREFYDKGQIERALETLLAGIKNVPEEKNYYYTIAEMLLGNRQYNDALEILSALPQDETDLSLALLTGYAKEGLGFSQEAAQYAERALTLNAASAAGLNLKGILVYKKGDRETAMDIFKKAIAADPGYGKPYTNLGYLAWAAGQHHEAFDLFERGIILSPAEADVIAAYHSAVTEMKTYAQAEEVFRAIRTLRPLDRRIMFLLIDVLIKQKNYGPAMQEIEQSMILFGVDDGLLSAALDIRSKIGPHEIGPAANKNSSCSLCMIVKNEEHHIAKCLMSVKPVVDEMIVVDTGSTDRTKDIARAFGAKVFDFPWTGDFSEARNVSLAKAAGDWILILDADEVIAESDHVALRRLITKEGKKRSAFSLATRNYIVPVYTTGWTANDGNYAHEEAGTGWFPSYKVRLFPRDSRIRFVNPVHELVETSLINSNIPVKGCDIPVHHYGKLDAEKDIAKGEEYYLLGKKKLEETGETVNALRELAIQAGGLKRYEEAIELWRKALKLQPDLTLAHLSLGSIYLEIDRYDDALAATKKAFELAPEMKEAAYNYALCELYAGNVVRSISVLEELAATSPDYPSAKVLLAMALCCGGTQERRLELFRQLQRMNFGFAESILKLSRKLVAAGQVNYASSLLDAAIEANNVNADILHLREECRR